MKLFWFMSYAMFLSVFFLFLQPRNFPRPTKQQVDLKQQKDVDLLKAQTLRKEGPAAVANDVDLCCGPILPASSHVSTSFKIAPTLVLQHIPASSFKLLIYISWLRYVFCGLQVYYWIRSRGGGEGTSLSQSSSNH